MHFQCEGVTFEISIWVEGKVSVQGVRKNERTNGFYLQEARSTVSVSCRKGRCLVFLKASLSRSIGSQGRQGRHPSSWPLLAPLTGLCPCPRLSPRMNPPPGLRWAEDGPLPAPASQSRLPCTSPSNAPHPPFPPPLQTPPLSEPLLPWPTDTSSVTPVSFLPSPVGSSVITPLDPLGRANLGQTGKKWAESRSITGRGCLPSPCITASSGACKERASVLLQCGRTLRPLPVKTTCRREERKGT